MSHNHGYRVLFSGINTKKATLFVNAEVTAAEGSVDKRCVALFRQFTVAPKVCGITVAIDPGDTALVSAGLHMSARMGGNRALVTQYTL